MEETVPDIVEGTVLWQPSPEQCARSQMAGYMRWLAAEKQLHFDSYQALWQWSVTEIEAFWASLWEYFAIRASVPYTRVLDESRGVAWPRWFEVFSSGWLAWTSSPSSPSSGRWYFVSIWPGR